MDRTEKVIATILIILLAAKPLLLITLIAPLAIPFLAVLWIAILKQIDKFKQKQENQNIASTINQELDYIETELSLIQDKDSNVTPIWEHKEP